MKTKLCLLLTALIFLTGCSGHTQAADSSAFEPTTEQSQTEPADPLTYSEGTTICSNSSGAYFVVTSPDLKNNLIYYMDYKTQQMIVLCNQPNCAHNDDSCTAWIPVSSNVPQIAALNEGILLVYPGLPYLVDQYGKDALPKIQIADSAGGNAKTLASFGANIQLDPCYAIDSQNIYLFKQDVSSETLTQTKTLIQLNLKTGKETSIASFDLQPGENYFWVGTHGEDFVFKKMKVTTTSKDPKQQRLSQLHQMFILHKDGTQEPPFEEWNQLNGYERFVDGKLLLAEDSSLKELLCDGEPKIIQNEIFNPSDLNILAAFDSTVIVSSSIYRSAAYDAPICYSADFETGEVLELQNVTDLGPDSQFHILAQLQDLLILEYYTKDGTQQIALMPKTDFLGGQAIEPFVTFRFHL